MSVAQAVRRTTTCAQDDAPLACALVTDEDVPTAGEIVVASGLSLVPILGGALAIVYQGARARHRDRLGLFLQEVTKETGTDLLEDRLTKDEIFDTVFVTAAETASLTGLAAKRRLLAKVIAQATVHEAKVDTAQLVVLALRDLDAPHIRALVHIRDAQDAADAEEAPYPGKRDENAENAVKEATRDQPLPVKTALLHTGVAIGSSGLSFSPGGTSVGRLSDFGRELLNDLERMDDAGQLSS